MWNLQAGNDRKTVLAAKVIEQNSLCSVSLAVCCGSRKLDSGPQCLQTGAGGAVSLSASPPAVALQVAWQGSGGNEKFFFDNENVSRMGQNAPLTSV